MPMQPPQQQMQPRAPMPNIPATGSVAVQRKPKHGNNAILLFPNFWLQGLSASHARFLASTVKHLAAIHLEFLDRRDSVCYASTFAQ